MTTINERIDDAYRAKYRDSPYLESMISARTSSDGENYAPGFGAGVVGAGVI